MEPVRTTALGAALGAQKNLPTTAAGSAFSAALAGARVCERYYLQLASGKNVPCAITLLGHEALLMIESVIRRRMRDLEIPEGITTQDFFEGLRARHILQLAVREWNPEKGAAAPALGTIEEWGDVSWETLVACYGRYNELREIHDPLAEDVPLSSTEALEIRAAIEKKAAAVLRLFGLQKLTAFLLTTEFQPVSSPKPKSELGDSPAES